MKLKYKLMRDCFDARQRPEPWGKGYSIGYQDGFEDGFKKAKLLILDSGSVDILDAPMVSKIGEETETTSGAV